MTVPPSAFQDPFLLDRLPAPSLQPDLLYTLPELCFPARLNAAQFLVERAMEKAGAQAIYFGGPIRWTATELADQAMRFARLLTTDYGLVPGHRVLIRAPNSPLFMVALLGTMLAGGVALPSAPALGHEELSHILKTARPNVAFCTPDRADALARAATLTGHSPVLCQADDSLLHRLSRCEPQDQTVLCSADDPALILFTSGTTGRAKAVVHSHKALCAVTGSFGAHIYRAQPDDLVIGSPSLAFAYGLGLLFACPLAAGASIALQEENHPAALLDHMAQLDPSILVTVPTAYRRMLALGRDIPLGRLRRCFSAGEPLSPDLAQEWMARTGLAIIDVLGSTEMLGPYITTGEGTYAPGSIGRAVPGYMLKIIDDTGAQLAPGETGRLLVRGPTGACYLDPENQAQAVQDGWTLSGDLCRMNAAGDVWFKGRYDDLILSSGYTLSAIEVEQVLATHPQVTDCAVIGLPDPDRGQIIAAVIEVQRPLDAEEQTSLGESLIAHIKQRIAPYKAPRRFVFVKALPRTASGKIRRAALRSMFGQDIQ
ncbi:acyl-CoA synthetase [Iodidimonas gelatinilytica]|nr:AMP-binding protein [Iodidimonas gelatinilytica]